jgi:hypothetical protein
MNLREPYRYKQLNLDNIIYSKPKQLSNKKIIYVKYNDNNTMNQLVFQCPTLLNINKPTYATDEYQELEIPITTQDKDKQQQFIDFIQSIDDKVVKDATSGRYDWNCNSNITYKKILKESNLLKLKVIKSKDFETLIQSESNKKIKPNDIPVNTWCKILLEVYAIVVNNKTNTYNILLRPIIISFKEKMVYNYSVIDCSDDEEDDNVLDTEVNNIFFKQNNKVSDNTYSEVNKDIISSVNSVARVDKTLSKVSALSSTTSSDTDYYYQHITGKSQEGHNKVEQLLEKSIILESFEPLVHQKEPLESLKSLEHIKPQEQLNNSQEKQTTFDQSFLQRSNNMSFIKSLDMKDNYADTSSSSDKLVLSDTTTSDM